ncbi:MAG: amidohydrolase family protein [Candidatus Accumulibacter sp.]|jgi:mannonate dehydratase|nr:amidohydrolase family protein [Accumulibacter sp.]
MNRRRFLQAAASLAAAAAALEARARQPLLMNPCRAPALGALAESPWLARVWQGLDPAEVWDVHVHLAGIGDSDGGLHVGSRLLSPWHPILYGQRLAYLNAGCVSGEPGTVDENYVRRLAALARGLPAGVKALLFAFDWYHDDDGRPAPEKSTFHVPDAYAARVAEDHPDVFAWAASIHPYAPDAVDRLEAAAARGAKAVKWLPAAQNIDPAARRCDAFFAALARLRLPLITHCGAEKAAQSASLEHFGNPLRLRRALDAGARVVVAHCASAGRDEDLDQPGKRRTSFELFTRLMERPEWKGNLFGDISAIVLRNRKPSVLRALLEREDWHGRLLNGSDYPLPGILPLISPAALARDGLLPKEAVADLEKLREHNPLYFDLALKRNLSWRGKTFPARVFATRGFFEGKPYQIHDGALKVEGKS